MHLHCILDPAIARAPLTSFLLLALTFLIAGVLGEDAAQVSLACFGASIGVLALAAR